MAAPSDLVARYLERWRGRLLDLSRRNPLVSLRGGRKVCLPLSRPLPQAVLDALVREGLPLTFWMPPVDEEAPRPRGRRSALDVGRYDPQSGQLLCGDFGRRELHATLTNLYRRSHADHQERGLHTLHVVFGVLEWQEKGKPGTLRSPLLLLPVRLARASLASPFTLLGVDEPPLLNPALDARLRRDDVGVSLPPPPEEWGSDSLAGWFRSVETAAPKAKLDRCSVLTLLSFHKGVMYQDLVENADRASRHFLVRALAGVEPLPPQPAAPDERSLDDTPPEETFHILDADASQRVCLEAARRGQSFVLLGPPGTGKSQTIANLIAAAVADGKTVLFVSEKVAALEVVSGRLRRAGLGELLLELHGSRVSKQTVVEELWRCLQQPTLPEPPGDGEMFARLRLRREQLNDYVRALHEPRPPLGKSVWQAFGEVARREGIVRVPLGMNDPLAITPEWLERAEGLARRTQQLWHVCVEGEQFPWRGFRADCYTLPLRDEVAELLERARSAASRLRSAAAEYAARLGIKGDARPAFLLELAELLDSSPAPPAAWLTATDLPDLEGEAHRLAAEAEEQRRRSEVLVARRGEAVLALPDGTADALLDAVAKAEPLLTAPQAILPRRQELLAWTRDAEASVAAWRSAGAVLARWFGVTLDEAPFAALRGLLRLLELSQAGAQPDRTWFDPLALRRAREAIVLGRDASAEHRRRRDWLLTRYDERFLDLDLDRLAERFGGPYRGWLRTLYPGYHAARRAVARVSRDGTAPPTVREDILSAREVRSLHRRLKADQPLYSAALGHFYQGLHSDFDAAARAVAVAEEALAVAQRFGWHPFPSPLAEAFAHAARPPADVALAARQLGESLETWEQSTDRLRPVLRLDAMPDRGCALNDASLAELERYAARLAEAASVFAACGLAPPTPDEDVTSLVADLRAAAALREWAAGFEAGDEDRRQRFGAFYRGADTDWDALRSALSWTHRVRDLFDGSPPRGFVRIASAGPTPAPPAAPLRDAAESLDEALATLDGRFTPPGPGLRDFPHDALERHLAAMAERVGELQDEVDWRALAERYRELGLGAFWDALCAARPPADQVADVLLLAVHLAWATAVCEREPALRDFRRAEHEERVAEFCRLDRDAVRAGAARVVRLAAGREAEDSAEATRLGREASKRGRHLPLRQLFAEVPGLLRRLKPCLLMSPLTVSQYLDPEKVSFDLVVFDEASQICPEDAVGAIFRGRQVVVVGDSKQLPPTAFFQGQAAGGDDEEADAPADFTSILDACQGAGLPVRMLRWHYRSRHESLIAYSNRHFYDNRLVTFPAARAACPSLGVSFVHVPDGVYDRGGRCDNVREAATVVDLVVSHFRERPEKTLGVIAFSHAQMNAVADEVERRAREAPELERFLAEDRLEGFFVKNLETVQGDERDVILFSVGYGRDAQGRLAMNFGPLNGDDGERRLNVAITRAREKVVVVSSLEARDLRITAATPAGVQHLRRYLEFAAGATTPDRWSAPASPTPLVEEVARVVEAFGYPVVRGVGLGESRIDLGVLDPSRPDTFLLAVECDGGAYRAAATARDRDRLRGEVLEALGWRVHRVWSAEWFRDRDEEIARLREALEAARLRWTLSKRPRPTAGAGTRLAELTRRITTVNGHTFPGATAYRVCDLGVREEFRGGTFTDRAARQEQARLLARLVDAEGPVHVEVAAERLRKAWGLSRTGERMREAIEEAVAFCESRDQLSRREDFLWPASAREVVVRVPDPAVPESYRDVLHIAPEELQAGLRLLTREGLGEDAEELLTQAARLFGFGRLGDHIRRRLAENLEAMKRQGRGRLVGVVS